ncbi:MAG: hypothetical protein ACRYHQ_36975, partial [Janthinobacterium lividum]
QIALEVTGNVAETDQAGTLAQCQHLHEQHAQHSQMPAEKLAGGSEVWPVQRGDRLEVEPLLAARREKQTP